MPKTFRSHIAGGINIIADKGLEGDGWVSAADNVDLRSGVPRSFPWPVRTELVPSSTTNCIYERRGKWIFSDGYRSYAAERIYGKDILYYTEAGKKPHKMVENYDVPLGTPAPSTGLVVTPAASSVMSLEAATVEGGSFQKNTVISYRISAETKDGVQPPSSAYIVNIVDDVHKAVNLSWTLKAGAIAYHIFRGTGNNDERELAVVSSVSKYIDVGSVAPNGVSASTYDNNNPLRYLYTFWREVDGVSDESGPSELSQALRANAGRNIIVDAQNDGLYEQDTTMFVHATGLTVTNSAALGTFSITSASFNPVNGITKFILGTAITLDTYDRVRFTLPAIPSTQSAAWGGDIEAWMDQSDPTNKTIFVKTAGATPDTTDGYVTYAKTLIYSSSPTAFAGMAQDDVAKVSLLGSGGTTATTIVGRITPYTSGSNYGFYLHAFTESGTGLSDAIVGVGGTYAIAFTPKNGGYKYRRIYRTGDASGYMLVKELPLWETSFTDGKVASQLGDPIGSYYVENGKSVIFQPPPVGLTMVTSHYGMLFGIDGYNVRWTPAGKRDAWPAAFSLDFESKPVALASYAQGLIVLCEDGIYRIDGTTPTLLSRSRTRAENGCYAPFSVQNTHAGLVYLSQRGLMLFDGNNAECITDRKVPGSFFFGTSIETTPINYWVKPTLMSYNYAKLTKDDRVLGSVGEAILYDDNTPMNGYVDDIRSFYHNGKYFLYYPNKSGNYGANTMVCVDLQAQGMPITTLGLKPKDVFIGSDSNAYFLFANCEADTTATSIANREAFLTAQGGMTDSFSPAATSSVGVCRWDWTNPDRLPYHIRTGQQSMGDPTTRKKFWDVKMYGSDTQGTLHVRVYMDGRYICDGRSVLANSYNQIRKVNIPNGWNAGYTLDLEFAGDAKFRTIEYNYDYLGGAK